MQGEYRGNLRRLSRAEGLHVAPDDPDPRGWILVDEDRANVGRVDDLFVDVDAMKVKYFEAALDRSRDGKHVLIPTDCVDVDERQQIVRVRGCGAERLGELASYEGDNIGDEQLGSARRLSDAARLTRAEEEVRLGKREVSAGEVRLSKHIETERVTRPVTRRHEEVIVERRPVTGSSGEVHMGDEDEIRIPIVEEEVVVEKRPVIKEELIARKKMVEADETVETEIRKEVIDVDRPERTQRDQGRKATPDDRSNKG